MKLIQNLITNDYLDFEFGKFEIINNKLEFTPNKEIDKIINPKIPLLDIIDLAVILGIDKKVLQEIKDAKNTSEY